MELFHQLDEIGSGAIVQEGRDALGDVVCVPAVARDIGDWLEEIGSAAIVQEGRDALGDLVCLPAVTKDIGDCHEDAPTKSCEDGDVAAGGLASTRPQMHSRFHTRFDHDNHFRIVTEVPWFGAETIWNSSIIRWT